jgi:toxin-antitoxin system PIN domain toxin
VISFDTNVLFPAVVRDHPDHAAAASFLGGLTTREDVAVSELVLIELYVVLRQPAVMARPLDAAAAASVCQAFRRHPRWRLIGFPSRAGDLHDRLWREAAAPSFPRSRIYDVRLALTLLAHGVSDLATVNGRDFRGLGFRRVFNPLS